MAQEERREHVDGQLAREAKPSTDDTYYGAERRNTEAIEIIIHDLKSIKNQLATVTEILTAWNNAKGFIKTVKFIGDAIKWAAPAIAAITAYWYYISRDK